MNKRLAKLKNIQEANIHLLNRNTKKSLNEGRFDDDDEFLNNDFYRNNELKTDNVITTKDNDSDSLEGVVFTTKPKSDVSLNMLASSAFQGMSALEAKENEPFLLPRILNHVKTDEFKDILNLTPENFNKKTFFKEINKQKKEWINLINQKNEVAVIPEYDKICIYPSNPSLGINELIKKIFDDIKEYRRRFRHISYEMPPKPPALMRTYSKERAPIKNFYLENPSWVDPNETIQSLKTYIKTDKIISNIINNIILLV